MTVLLYASTCRPTSREANAVQIDRMCRAFECLGHQVVLTALAPAARIAAPYRTWLLRWPVQRLRMRLMERAVARLVQRLPADIVYSRSPLLAKAALAAGAAPVLELHALPKLGTRTEEALREVAAHPRLRRIVAISQILADDVVATYGSPRGEADIVVAHDGADVGQRRGPAPEAGGALRVGYFGHLYPGKGMETIAALAPLLPHIRFDVFGGTDADIARWRSTVATQKNLALHGHLPHREVASRMVACDVLIAPYRSNVSDTAGNDITRWMSPLKIFEYMAAERPIVTSDLPVLREVVCDGETALLCPPDDIQAWAAALQRLTDDPALRRRLGGAARDLLEAKYTWDRRAARVLEGIDS